MRLLLAALLVAQYEDPVVERGFDHFYNLEYPQAIAEFRKAIEARPTDPHRHNHLAQAVLFQMMFRAGALDTEMVTGGNPFLRRARMEPTAEEQKLFAASIGETLRLTAQALEKNPRDTGALYARGVALSFRGTYNFLVRRAWMDALRDITDARKLHNRVAELEPSNMDALMLQGVHDYIVGSLPWYYRTLGFLVGFRGDRARGVRTVRLVAEKGKWNRVDAKILLGIVSRRERRPQDAVPIILELLEKYPRNFLLLFELSQMYSDLGRKADALAALDRIEELKQSGAPGFVHLPIERIEFARGNLLFWYDEPEAAISHLRRATAGAAKLDLNSAVTAWLRLGQCLDLIGRRAEALEAYRAAVKTAPSAHEAKLARRWQNRPFDTAEKRALARGEL
ncbi:MAG: tetratricopeptide repeat protein [Bryobacteraceae bacterium]